MPEAYYEGEKEYEPMRKREKPKETNQKLHESLLGGTSIEDEKLPDEILQKY